MNTPKPIKGILALLGLLMQHLEEAGSKTIHATVATVQDTFTEMDVLQREIVRTQAKRVFWKTKLAEAKREQAGWAHKNEIARGELEDLESLLAIQVCESCEAFICHHAGTGRGPSPDCGFKRKMTEEDAAEGLSALFVVGPEEQKE